MDVLARTGKNTLPRKFYDVNTTVSTTKINPEALVQFLQNSVDEIHIHLQALTSTRLMALKCKSQTSFPVSKKIWQRVGSPNAKLSRIATGKSASLLPEITCLTYRLSSDINGNIYIVMFDFNTLYITAVCFPFI